MLGSVTFFQLLQKTGNSHNFSDCSVAQMCTAQGKAYVTIWKAGCQELEEQKEAFHVTTDAGFSATGVASQDFPRAEGCVYVLP